MRRGGAPSGGVALIVESGSKLSPSKPSHSHLK
jgi:hypothetical protein